MISINPASQHDATAISRLITRVSHYFTSHPEGGGAEKFFKTIQPSSIKNYIANDIYLYFSAFVGDELAGVIAIRDNNHLFHLFVAPKFQRQGIAKKLWHIAKKDAIRAGNTRIFTVNSTEIAVPVYKSFGFKTTGPKVEKDGIIFVPMKLIIKK